MIQRIKAEQNTDTVKITTGAVMSLTNQQV